MPYDKEELKNIINSDLEPHADSVENPAATEQYQTEPKTPTMPQAAHADFALNNIGSSDAYLHQAPHVREVENYLQIVPPESLPMVNDQHGTSFPGSRPPQQLSLQDPHGKLAHTQQEPQYLAPKPEHAIRHPRGPRATHSGRQGQPVAYPDQDRISGQKRSYDVSQYDNMIKRSNEEPKLDTGSEDISINFDFDGEYKDVPEDRPLRIRRERRTGCVGGLLYSAFVISISLVLASLICMATVDVLGFGTENELVSVTVPDGFTIDDIADMLLDAGLIKYRFLFMIYADFSDAEEKISPGSYVLNRSYDYRALVQGMTARAGVREETTVTIPEGYTLAQIFNLLEEYGVTPASDLWEAARYQEFNYDFLEETVIGDRLRLEGFLFPDTYNFFLESTPTQVLNRLLREFDRRFTEEMVERAEEMGYTVREITIIASMIEREAGSDDERSRIAAVIYNRLDNWSNPLLQIDATINYAIAGTDRAFDIDFDSLYNTYTHAGLPPGPIANPGMASIHAALHPDSTNEFYYALNKEDTHEFFRTYDEQRAFINSDEYGGR